MTIVGIVGAGVMGAGISQVALEAGWEVVLHDVDEDAIERATGRIRDGLARRAAKLDLDADSIDAWVDGRLDRLRHAHTLDGLASESTIIIEAAIEDLDLKQAIFRALDAESSRDVLLATNTSALPVTAIAEADQACGSRPRAPLLQPGAAHGPRRGGRGCTNRRRRPSSARPPSSASGARPRSRSADRPGFIVNRVNRPFTIEALRMLEDGVAGVVEIDEAMRAGGFPMGPFELMDLSGLDVNLAAARGVWDGLGRPDRLRPSPIQERLVAAGRLGRKTGGGFYRYEDGRRGAVDPEFGDAPARGLSAERIQARIERAVSEEARFAVEEGVASADDVVTALRLGAGHPDRMLAAIRETLG